MSLGFIDSIQKILREAYHAYHEINTETPLLLHQKRVMEKCLVIYFFICACCCNLQHSFSACSHILCGNSLFYTAPSASQSLDELLLWLAHCKCLWEFFFD